MDRTVAEVQCAYQRIRKFARHYNAGTLEEISMKRMTAVGKEWDDELTPGISKRVRRLCEMLGV